LVKNLSSRNRDIITRRFGLKTGKKETLESIGQSYGITRERVRQIEEFTFGQLTKTLGQNNQINDFVEMSRKILAGSSGVMKERDLFRAFSGNEKDSVTNSALVFCLTLNGEFYRFNENNNFTSFWALSEKHAGHFRDSTTALIGAFNENKAVLSMENFSGMAKENKITDFEGRFSEEYLRAILSVSKDISRNIFGEVGLAVWPEIRPRGVKDKAYLVLKKAKEPRHFGEIAKLINSTNFSDRKANIQTVHNELIKDGRFVLIGRGLYALSEWGYKPGTVKDVLIDILKESAKPLAKAELVAKIMNARRVKENTILLNLQDSKVFKKGGDGTYTLKKV